MLRRQMSLRFAMCLIAYSAPAVLVHRCTTANSPRPSSSLSRYVPTSVSEATLSSTSGRPSTRVQADSKSSIHLSMVD